MSSNKVRLNVTLPKHIYRALSEQAGPRQKSRFIAHAIQNQIERHHKKALIKALKEGYRNTRKESGAIADDFSSASIEGWDDY